LDEPVYFLSRDQKLFGWLHQPADMSSVDAGIVICNPFGYEALCGHRSIRAFVSAFNALDLPTLRFDYLGTGDSPDIDSTADQLSTWVEDAVNAVLELRRRTGVARICLVGFRLGALIATLAAARCKTVDRLLLIAPVISGPRYLRELRLTQLAGNLGEDGASSPTRGALEVSGYSLSVATVDALAGLDLEQRTPPRVNDVLVIDRSDLPSARSWTDALAVSGIKVQYLALPGFVEMMLRAPQFAATPVPMIDAARAWLSTASRPMATSGAAASTCQRAIERLLVVPPATFLTLPNPDGTPDAEMTERPVLFGSEALLFGIVTEPSRTELRRRAVILLNAAADYHIGASRMYVALARRWARRGYFVMRLDLAGLGDSETRPGREPNEVFPLAAIDDIRAAIDFMRARYCVGDMTLAGLCSGAYHAFRAAAEGFPINRIFLVNPQTLYWKDGMSNDDAELIEVVQRVIQSPNKYGRRALSVGAWKKLLSGRANVQRILRVNLHKVALAAEAVLRDGARRLRVPIPRDLGRELERIVGHGVRIVVVFAEGEPGLALLRLQAGSALKRLGDRCRVHIIDAADHTFSRSRSRSVLEDTLTEELMFDGLER
jgi:alpha-beta hydrolase superfamily lysophospholipase